MNNITKFEDFHLNEEHLDEKRDNDNTKAIKALIADLEDTPHSVGLALLRERLLHHAKSDLKNIEANPKAWENPIFGPAMYKDLFNRIIKILEFK